MMNYTEFPSAEAVIGSSCTRYFLYACATFYKCFFCYDDHYHMHVILLSATQPPSEVTVTVEILTSFGSLLLESH